MRRRNSYLLVLVFLGLTAHFVAQSGSAPPAEQTPTTSAAPAPTQAAPATSPTAGSSQVPAPQSAPQGSEPAQTAPQDAGQPVNQGAGQAPDTGDSGAFVFKKQVEEVVLHATVFD